MSAQTGLYFKSYRTELALFSTRAERVRLVVLIVALISVPFVASPFWMTVLSQISIAAIGALGLNVLVGFTGQISLGQGGFLAVGAYTSGILVARLGMPTLVGIMVAVLAGATIGAMFGLPALRLKGLYLAIATLAAQFIILFAVRTWEPITGGADAIVVPRPELFGFQFNSDFRWYWISTAVAVVIYLGVSNVMRTGVGRAFMAIRDHDIAAEAIGINLVRYKVLSFAFSSGIVALAGALIAHSRSIVTWERFTLEVSILYLAMIIIGGLGSISGSAMGAVFMISMPAVLTQLGQAVRGSAGFLLAKLPAIQLILFGLVIVVFLLTEPRGLARIWSRVRDYFRLWPFRY